MDQLAAKLDSSRSELRGVLEKLINEAVDLPQIQLAEYGSFKTGLLTPFSDVDFLVEHQETLDKDQTVFYLQRIEERLKGCEFVENITGIYSAQIPVIKLTTKQQIGESEVQLRADLVLSQSPYEMALCTSHRTTSFLVKYLA